MAIWNITMNRFLHILIFISCLFSLITPAKAQQDPNFSMYMFNNQYFNPAYAGTAEFITASVFYRRQWISMPGAPITQNFTAIVPYPRKHLAFAANVVNDKIGITGATNVSLGAAYYINLKEGRLSFGLDLGIQQFRLNGEQLNLEQTNDNTFTNQFATKMAPNVNAGIFYKKQKYYVGISATHLNNPGRAILKNGDVKNPAVTARHYYLTGGYVIEIDDKFTLTPSILSRYSESPLFTNNFSSDFSFKVDYKEILWMGTTYRTSDAIGFFTGFNLGKIDPDSFKENIKIGYGFDYTVSRIPTYNGGTHEIFISYEYAPKVKRAMPKFK